MTRLCKKKFHDASEPSAHSRVIVVITRVLVVTSAVVVVVPATDGRARVGDRRVVRDDGGGAGAGASRRGGVFPRGDDVDGFEIERGVLARRV